ncbi:MAG: protein of unknown function DUF1653 [uncultured bacterium (gcode 4)]|uniref:DUF1653 domain-containing protein n=1 Tax=uncultured bacterium (gcode 4) TaxID=1234023 RepID=K2FA84_9BACT|nr:MAG: protein of unknown function DUF1653 [uncultured bacterium (gcode 4)]
MEVKLWKYRHFKWTEIEVIWIWKHSETIEDYVVYRHITKDPITWEENSLWVRPLKMFAETVEKDGKMIPRFEYIEIQP